jgi:branched-chain amino acid transport system substrate-binding protein
MPRTCHETRTGIGPLSRHLTNTERKQRLTVQRTTRRKRTWLVGGLSVLALLATSCGDDDSSSEASTAPTSPAADTTDAASPDTTAAPSGETTPPASAETTPVTESVAPVEPYTIKVGFITALSGPAAASNKPLQDGAQAGVDWLNAGNAKAPGATYELDVRDSGGDPNKTAVLIRELLDSGVNVVLGEFGGAPSFLAEQPALNERPVPAFTSAPADSIWGDAGEGKAYPWAFGIVGDQTGFATPLIEAALAATQNATIAQILPNSGSAPEWAKLTEPLAEPAGVSVSSQEFAATATDVKAQLRDLQDSGADTLIAWSYGAGLQTILTNLDELGWYPKVITLPDAGRQSLIDAVPNEVMQNVIAGPVPATFVSADGSAATGVTAEFLTALSEVTGRGEGAYEAQDITSAYTFDSLVAYDSAVAQAGGTDPEAVKDALQTGTYEGAMGPHTWTADSRSGFDKTSFALFSPLEPCSNGTCVAAG